MAQGWILPDPSSSSNSILKRIISPVTELTHSHSISALITSRFNELSVHRSVIIYVIIITAAWSVFIVNKLWAVKVCEPCSDDTYLSLHLQSSSRTPISLGRRGRRWCPCEERRWGWSPTGPRPWRRHSNAGEQSPRKPPASPVWTRQGSLSMSSHMVTSCCLLTLLFTEVICAALK